MTSYELWLFLHISAAVLWIGGAVAVQVFGALAKASGDPARSAAFGKDTGVMVRWVFMPSSLIVLVTGILLCITIIGIPLGVASFKMAGAALVPFGKEVVDLRSLATPPAGAVVVPDSR